MSVGLRNWRGVEGHADRPKGQEHARAAERLEATGTSGSLCSSASHRGQPPSGSDDAAVVNDPAGIKPGRQFLKPSRWSFAAGVIGR